MQQKGLSRRLRNRKGFTLILTAFFFTVLLGAAALAVDMSLMYLYRAQLQSAADAAALAGATGLGKNEGNAAATSVSTYIAKDSVGGGVATLVSATAGTWDGTFHAGAWTDATAHADDVVVSVNKSYVFARAFGKTTQTLHASAIAVHGSAKGQSCMRPWAINYQILLDKIYPSPPNVRKDGTTYSLTQADIAKIAALGSGSDGAVDFDGARLPPAQYADGSVPSGGTWPGGSNYRAAEGATCQGLATMMAAYTSNPYISAGDYLYPETGVKNGPTKQGIGDLCTAVTCPTPVVVALYDYAASIPKCNGPDACWHIKYVAKFMLTGFDNGSKSPTGYFLSMNDPTGPFSPTAGPISKNGLVK
jgi:Flp pilus assembly protein TadG